MATVCFLWCSLTWGESQQSDTPRLRTLSPSVAILHLVADEVGDRWVAAALHLPQVRRDAVILPNANV